MKTPGRRTRAITRREAKQIALVLAILRGEYGEEARHKLNEFIANRENASAVIKTRGGRPRG